jgi:hypothetical protein
MTINSYFDENIDGIKLDNIVIIMTIINVNGSLTSLTLRSATATTTTTLASLRAMRHGASLDNTHVLQTCLVGTLYQ